MELLCEGGKESLATRGDWGMRVTVRQVNGMQVTYFEDAWGNVKGVAFEGGPIVTPRTPKRFANPKEAARTALMSKEIRGTGFRFDTVVTNTQRNQWEFDFVDHDKGPCTATVSVRDKEILVSRRIK